MPSFISILHEKLKKADKQKYSVKKSHWFRKPFIRYGILITEYFVNLHHTPYTGEK